MRLINLYQSRTEVVDSDSIKKPHKPTNSPKKHFMVERQKQLLSIFQFYLQEQWKEVKEVDQTWLDDVILEYTKDIWKI